MHHIEGVCKPWSAAKLALQEVINGFVLATLSRDKVAAILRAEQARLAAVERAERYVEERRQAKAAAIARAHSKARERASREPRALDGRRAARALGQKPPLMPTVVQAEVLNVRDERRER